MRKLKKTKRLTALTAATVALAGGAALGLGGSASAAVGDPDPSTTGGWHLFLQNDAYNQRYFLICNYTGSAQRVWVDVHVADQGDTYATLQDVNTGWTTTGTHISFNNGGCEEFNILNYNGYPLLGQVNPYDTGWVAYN